MIWRKIPWLFPWHLLALALATVIGVLRLLSRMANPNPRFQNVLAAKLIYRSEGLVVIFGCLINSDLPQLCSPARPFDHWVFGFGVVMWFAYSLVTTYRSSSTVCSWDRRAGFSLPLRAPAMTTSSEGAPRQPAFGRSVRAIRVYKRVSKTHSPRKPLRGHETADLELHLQRTERTGDSKHPHHKFVGALDASWWPGTALQTGGGIVRFRCCCG